MITGLQINIRGEELSRRIDERIRMHEAAIGALDVRIKEREGDLPFDVRVEDGSRRVAIWRTNASTIAIGSPISNCCATTSSPEKSTR